MGSGIGIRNAIKKYGKVNFIKEIIADYPTRLEVSNHEMEIVTHDLVLDENCYNTKLGGDPSRRDLSGKNNPFYGKKHSEETKQRLSEMNSGINGHFYGKKHTEEVKKYLSESRIGKYVGDKSPNFGKIWTDEQKQKISKANTGKKRTDEHKQLKSQKSLGENNHFYGKKHTTSTKAKIAEKVKELMTVENRQKLSNICKTKKPCIILGNYYSSIREATITLNVTKPFVQRRLNSAKYPDWIFVDK